LRSYVCVAPWGCVWLSVPVVGWVCKVCVAVCVWVRGCVCMCVCQPHHHPRTLSPKNTLPLSLARTHGVAVGGGVVSSAVLRSYVCMGTVWLCVAVWVRGCVFMCSCVYVCGYVAVCARVCVSAAPSPTHKNTLPLSLAPTDGVAVCFVISSEGVGAAAQRCSVRMSAWRRVAECACGWVCVGAWLCVHACVRGCVCMCVCVAVCVCVCVCLSLSFEYSYGT
jgi:hypothetical protein